MRRQALISHASVKSDKKHFDTKLFFFEPKNSEQSKAYSQRSQNNTPIEIEKDEPTYINQLSIEPMVKDSQKQKAEIVWVLKLVLGSYFNNSCADISKMFTCIFPDSKIAKSFERGGTKLKHVINFVSAVYFRGILYNH